MKLLKILSLTTLMVAAFSCSKDEDPEPKLEEAALSLSKESQVIEVPAAMMTNQDPYAQMAAGWIAVANGMSANLSLFTPPAGATTTTEAITPVNGRIASGAALVYTWTDANYGSVAYQIRDGGDKYIFELFYKGNGDSGWYRYLYAQELKDASEGYMVLYDAWGFMSDERNEEMMRWEWARSGDNFTFEFKDVMSEFSFTLTVNTNTKAGSLTYFDGTDKTFEVSWDAQGKGTWKEYESNEVVDEGSWG